MLSQLLLPQLQRAKDSRCCIVGSVRRNQNTHARRMKTRCMCGVHVSTRACLHAHTVPSFRCTTVYMAPAATILLPVPTANICVSELPNRAAQPSTEER